MPWKTGDTTQTIVPSPWQQDIANRHIADASMYKPFLRGSTHLCQRALRLVKGGDAEIIEGVPDGLELVFVGQEVRRQLAPKSGRP